MPNKQQEELELAVRDLVDRIVERGRLSVLEESGEIKVKDGGVEFAKIQYTQQILALAKTEATALADQIIGKDVEVPLEHPTIMDDELQPVESSLAVKNFQAKQRLALAHYQNPLPVPVMHYQEEKITARNFRVDRNKPTMELEGVTGREENSLYEE